MVLNYDSDLPLLAQLGPSAQQPENILAQIQNQLGELQQISADAGPLGFDNDIEDYWQPGVAEATNIYNQGLPELDPSGYLNAAMANVAAQNNPFMSNLGQFNAANPYTDLLGNAQTQNPIVNNLMGVDASNPYAGQLGGMDTSNPMANQLANIDTSNPYAGLLGGYGAQANPYADELFSIASENIQDQINSQFGRAGVGGGMGNIQEQIDQLGDFGAKFYGNIYDQQQNRLLNSLQSAGNLYGQGVGQGITAAGQAGSLYGQGVGQGIDAASRAGGLYGQGVGQEIGATEAAGGLFGQGVGQGLSALQGAGGLYNTGAGQNLQALTAGAGLQNSMNAMPLAMFPSVMQLQQNQPWQGLQNYSNIASQLTGASPQQPESPSTSGWDKLVGLGSIGLGIAGLNKVPGIP